MNVSNGQPNSRLIALIAIAATLILGVAAWIFWPSKDGPPDKPEQNDDIEVASKGFPRASFDMAIEAVAAAEDLDYDRALAMWTKLIKLHPHEESFRVNQGVTVLKWIDATNELLSSGNLDDPKERQQVEKELENAYSNVESAIVLLGQSEEAGSTKVLLQAALLRVRSDKLSHPQDKELLQEAGALLAEALQKNPDQPLLAAAFEDSIEFLGGQDEQPEYTQILTEAMYASWKSNPRNTFLLQRSLGLLLQAEDLRLLELLDASLVLTKPMWNEIPRYIKILKPETTIPQMKEMILAGEWGRPKSVLRGWNNLVGSMRSAFQPDQRKVRPDVMALLDTSFLRRLAQDIDPVPAVTGPAPEYRTEALQVKADQALWFDADIDLDADLLAVRGATVGLYESDGTKLAQKPISQVDVGFQIRGLLTAEFFGVDTPGRPRSMTVQELVKRELPSLEAGGKSSEEGGELVLTPEQIAIANRHDTLQEVFVWGQEGVAFLALSTDGKNQLALMETPTGLEEVRGVESAVVLDVESDGDLDIFLVTPDGPEIWQNNGNRTFRSVTEYSLIDAPDLTGCRLKAGDFDGDLDQDVWGVCPGSDGVLQFENILHGQFRLQQLSGADWPTLSQPTDIGVGDFDQNASWDIVVADNTQLLSCMTRTVDAALTPWVTQSLAIPSSQVEAHDLNNDGRLDVLCLQDGGLNVHLGTEDGSLKENPEAIPTEQPVKQIDVSDFNLDGCLDILAVTEDSILLLEGTNTEFQHIVTRVRGRNDDNGGGRINHFGVGTTLELWTDGRQQRRIVETPATHFGIGQQPAQNLRIIFPNGLTQNVEKPVANSMIAELQELKGSCPFVYGWNGERFELITDLLWNAPLGLQVARGEVMPDRRWEYLALPGELVQEKEGFYELRVTEELWEVAYFDLISLTAIDHPEGTQFFTNEKVGPPSIAQPKVFLPEASIHPSSARDAKGRDHLGNLRSVDRVYAKCFDSFLCQGLVEPHFLELDFADDLKPAIAQGRQLRMYLTGWMHPTDTSLNIAISQNGQLDGPQPPSLWVPGEDGKWVCAKEFIGFPGGKPKSIVVDLDGVFRSGDHRLRIATSQQLYWDQLFVAVDPPETSFLERKLQLESAKLRYRGFSELMPRTIHEPHWYDYQSLRTEAKWPALEGPFTRFGDVKDLLNQDDDRIVVMTSGDEIILRFRKPEEPLPNNWRRDFVMHNTGWDKDADLNTIAGQGSLPLPFAEQDGYPSSPEQQAQAGEVWRKNADTLTRDRQVSPSDQNL